MLIDSHCHLDLLASNNQLNEILERARANEIKIIQTISTKITDFNQLLTITKNHPGIYTSVGIHPNEVVTQPVTDYQQLLSYTSDPKVIGIGETGLDFYYSDQFKTKQIESFEQHIKAASLSNLPVIIHTRQAEVETIKLLNSLMQQYPFKGVIHCFTGSYELATKALDLGLYISISGIITFKGTFELQETVKKLPLSSLLIETDAPYLAPTPYRGKQNEPAYLKDTAIFLAQLLNIDYEHLANLTSGNFLKLFDKVNFRLE